MQNEKMVPVVNVFYFSQGLIFSAKNNSVWKRFPTLSKLQPGKNIFFQS